MVRMVVGIVLCLMGAVWFLQGISVIESDSFMTGEAVWSVIGTICVLVGGALIVGARRGA
jgi:uncharacterized membrane protein YidH (DUF202 family)